MLLAYQPHHNGKKAEDNQLWTALRNSQNIALEELFRRYHVRLYNYGVKITRDRELVKEAIQQLFLTLWKRHRYLGEAHSVKAYLLASLRRMILEQIQQNKARAIRNRDYAEEHSSTSFTIEDLLIRKEVAEERRQLLQKIFHELTPRQKEVIFLRFYHGLTNREIVEVMELNDQCVRNLLYDALRRLRAGVERFSYQD